MLWLKLAPKTLTIKDVHQIQSNRKEFSGYKWREQTDKFADIIMVRAGPAGLEPQPYLFPGLFIILSDVCEICRGRAIAAQKAPAEPAEPHHRASPSAGFCPKLAEGLSKFANSANNKHLIFQKPVSDASH